MGVKMLFRSYILRHRNFKYYLRVQQLFTADYENKISQNYNSPGTVIYSGILRIRKHWYNFHIYQNGVQNKILKHVNIFLIGYLTKLQAI